MVITKVLRKGWDSNPRKFLGSDSFQDCCNKPGSATLPKQDSLYNNL